MFSCHFMHYFDVTKWLYLSVQVDYLFFLISLPINAIILFIQTESQMHTNTRDRIYRMNQSQANITNHGCRGS